MRPLALTLSIALTACACGASSAFTLALRRELDPLDRAARASELTSAGWESGRSNDYSWSWEVLRFTPPDSVELSRGMDHLHQPRSAGSSTVGRYELTGSGALAYEVGDRHMHETFALVTSEHGARCWARTVYVSRADEPTVFWHEANRAVGESGIGAVGSEVTAVLRFGASLDAIVAGAACDAQLHVEARGFRGAAQESMTVDVPLHCRIEEAGAVRRIVFVDIPVTSPDRPASSDWSNWLSTHGHAGELTQLGDGLGDTFHPVLIWDPAAPRMLRAPEASRLCASSR